MDEARSDGKILSAIFTGKLRPDQEESLRAVLPHICGMLIATTAFGKTVTATAVIASRKVSTLVLVHRAELMRQWQERLGSFLDRKEQKMTNLLKSLSILACVGLHNK